MFVLVKYADDSALIGLIKKGHDLCYRNQINKFVEFCDLNHLVLNVSKTKEMVIDFSRKCKVSSAPITIKGSEVERVEEYKYLGVIIDNNLKFNKHVQRVEKRLKPHSVLFT